MNRESAGGQRETSTSSKKEPEEGQDGKENQTAHATPGKGKSNGSSSTSASLGNNKQCNLVPRLSLSLSLNFVHTNIMREN